MDALETELKHLIVESLKLEDVNPEDIDGATPLFDGGLALDSLDVLELGAVLAERYGVRLSGEHEEHRKALETIGALARFIERERPLLP